MACKSKKERSDSLRFLEDSIPRAIHTADVFMNLHKTPTKKSRQLEAPGTMPLETAGEDDTLMGRLGKRMASKDFIDRQNVGFGIQAKKATTADNINIKKPKAVEMADLIPGRMNLSNKATEVKDNQNINNNKKSKTSVPAIDGMGLHKQTYDSNSEYLAANMNSSYDLPGTSKNSVPGNTMVDQAKNTKGNVIDTRVNNPLMQAEKLEKY